jgi:hypothetical protein
MQQEGVIIEPTEAAFRAVAAAAWERQANHERFLFKTARPKDHPSRVPFANADKVWQAGMRVRKEASIVWA